MPRDLQWLVRCGSRLCWACNAKHWPETAELVTYKWFWLDKRCRLCSCKVKQSSAPLLWHGCGTGKGANKWLSILSHRLWYGSGDIQLLEKRVQCNAYANWQKQGEKYITKMYKPHVERENLKTNIIHMSNDPTKEKIKIVESLQK